VRSSSPWRSARAVSHRTVGALVVAAALACASGAPVSPPAPPPPAWSQVWGDEFSGPAGTGIDTANWRYDTGDGCAQGNCGWGNNEKEYYSSATENIALNGDGQLTIVARTAPPPAGLTCYYGPCRYTSAKITTRGKVSVLPGRVEARIKLAAGQGLWPAFWMLGENVGTVGWPACGELDIMENRGSQPNTTSSAVHGPGYSGNTPFAHAYGPVVATDFHVYGVEWDSQTIRYSVDGHVHFVVSRTAVQQYGSWAFNQSFFLLLNQAVGGHFDGDPQSDSVFPATMFVDYVRVYRRTDPG
jgi:beta-glucanase (GH16 family)